ncbi:MAG: serpin family protein [Anaerovoracaceae bacterium]
MLKRKRVLSLTLIFCLALPLTVFGSSPGQAENGAFTEMRASDGSAVSKAEEVTRGGFVSMLAEASEEDLRQYASEENPFSDVGEDDAAVRWAYAKWLVNGNGSGAFRPEDSLSRQEAAAILGRYLDYEYTQLPAGCGTGLLDSGNISEWAREGVAACCMYGIISEERDDGTEGQDSNSWNFRPLDKVSAADASQWIKNVRDLKISAVTVPEKKTFADNLSEAVATEAEGKNWSISPYSAQMALAMLTAGAKGQTQKELLSALQIEDIDDFGDSAEALLKKYDGFEDVISLETANSIWLNQSWFGDRGAFLPDYRRQMELQYRAEVREVTNSDSVEEVNAWVNEKTKGKIPTILSENNRDFVTALVNAVYFKAAWEKEFSEQDTKEGDFYNADGSRSKIDFMNQTDNFGYYSTPGVEAVKLDYKNYKADDTDGTIQKIYRDADFSMYLIKADDKMADLQNILDQAEFENGKVRLSVPKFKVEHSAVLDSALKAMGIVTAYDSGKSDFSAIVDPSSLPGGAYFLDTVLQKSYIAVDEKGTEAAAVTAVMGAGSSEMPPEREPLIREFIADEPFYFVIRDNTEGLVLFAGQYNLAQA